LTLTARTAFASAAVALVTLVAAPLQGCGGSSSRPPVVLPRPGGAAFGFNDYPDPQSVRLQTETGMPLRRFKVPWSDVEAVRGSWNWSLYDAQYGRIIRAGLRPLLVAIGAPCWTRPGRPCSPGPPDPQYGPEWSQYVHRLTARYSAVGVEVWNEPNIVPMWPPYPDPARFAALLDLAYRAVKGVNPELPVVSGGLFSTNRSGSYGIADSSFLAGLYRAGAGDEMDAIGAHPYPRIGGDVSGGRPRYDLAATEQALNRLRSVRNAAGHPRTPIWITEVGVSTASAPGFPPAATELQQAGLLQALVRVAQRDSDVRVEIIHRLIDTSRAQAGGPLGVFDSGFGVFDSSGRPKLSACVLSRIFGGSLARYGSCPSPAASGPEWTRTAGIAR
jgi:polysaccharide biosynthesis protein PslG